MSDTTSPFATMRDVKHAVANGPSPHWFSSETMRFFNSKVETALYRGRWFITSEDNFDRSQRMYSVRYAEDNGDITTIGEFAGYLTHKEALDAMWADINSR